MEGEDDALSSLGGRAPRRNELFVPPPLDGDVVELRNGGPENVPLNNPEDAPHLVVRPIFAVNPAGGFEDEEVSHNSLLQRMEQGDLQAVRNLLELPILDNINAQHLWQIMQKLRAILPIGGPYRILSSRADYARILRRTARVMTIPSREIYEMALGPHRSLGYDTVFQALEDSTPECPTEYGDCLESLCEHLTAAASMMPGSDGIFIFKDREEFGYSLRSLAALLTSVD